MQLQMLAAALGILSNTNVAAGMPIQETKLSGQPPCSDRCICGTKTPLKALAEGAGADRRSSHDAFQSSIGSTSCPDLTFKIHLV